MQGPGSIDNPSLAFVPLDVLQDLLPGRVYTRADPSNFQNRASIFNGNVVSPALAVVVPGCANDISVILRFCIKNNLSPSVKAGGYGTAGWAIGGDIVIDLSELDDIAIEPPDQDGGFRSIRDTPFVRRDRKGKGKVNNLQIDAKTSMHGNSAGSNLGKRRRSDDSVQETELLSDSKTSISLLPRSVMVERFLRTADIPGPSLRRRLGSPSSPILQTVHVDLISRNSLTESAVSSKASSNAGDDDAFNNISYKDTKVVMPSTTATSPGTTEDSRGATRGSEHIEPAERATELTLTDGQHLPTFAIRSTDPFSYMTTGGISATSRPAVAAFGISPSSSLSNAPTSVAHRPRIFPPVHPLQIEKSAETSSDASVVKDTETDYGASKPQTLLPEHAFMSSSVVPRYSRAYVTLSAGAKQADVDIFTAAHPLPATAASGASASIAYHVPLAAHPVGSSILLLGGFGFLSRLHGLSIDNLVEAEVVLADGSIVIASEKENPDLWWALRGAGPAFGIVTRYKAIAYPIPSVFAGNLIYEFHPATAASLLRHFRDVVKGVPPAVYANVLLTAGPAGRGALIVLQLCVVGGSGARPSAASAARTRSKDRKPPASGQAGVSAGGSKSMVTAKIAGSTSDTVRESVADLIDGANNPEQVNTEGPDEGGEVYYDPGQDGLGVGRALLQALASWEGGTPLLNEVAEKSFLAQQDSVAQILRGKRGRQWFIRSALINSLPDDVIYKTVTEFANTPIGCTWLFELAGAAVASADRSRDTCIPHTQREARFNVAAFHQWELGDDDPLCVTTAEHWIYETLAPVSVGGPLPAFLGRHERAERIEASYGEHWDRLRELKQRYDPNGLFRNTFWPLGPNGEVLDTASREPPSP